MKKIFTFLITICFVTIGFAQSQGHKQEREKWDDVAYNERSYGNDHRYKKSRYNFSRREMERSIAAINFDYDRRIQSVRNTWSMSSSRKRRVINGLEAQRKSDIREVYYRFKDSRNGYGYNSPDRH